MQQRLLIQILAILALLSANLALDPKLSFNTTLLCTESYWLQINFEGAVGDYIYFSGGSGLPYTRYKGFALISESGSVGTHVVYDPSLTYTAQMVNDTGDAVSEITLSAMPACTGLTTTGLTAGKQAVWVADVFRKYRDATARGYFWNSNLQAAADEIINSGSNSCDSDSLIPYLQTNGYNAEAAYCLLISSTTADAGALTRFVSSYWGIHDEIAVAQNITVKKWVMIFARRERSANCGNKFRAIDYEACDDGNTDDLDGCSNNCTVESGWMCSENVLQEGSTCVLAPPTAPVSVPVAAPLSSPTAQTPSDPTPSSQTPSSSPLGETPSSMTGPSAEIPSSSPSSAGSPSATPDSGFTPSNTPSLAAPSTIAQPSSPRPSRTPDSSIVNGSEKNVATFLMVVTVMVAFVAI